MQNFKLFPIRIPLVGGWVGVVFCLGKNPSHSSLSVKKTTNTKICHGPFQFLLYFRHLRTSDHCNAKKWLDLFIKILKVADQYFTIRSPSLLMVTWLHCKKMIREALIREKKDFLWNHFIKWWPPPPSPFYEVPIYFFPSIFWAKKNRWFWRLFEGCWWVI